MIFGLKEFFKRLAERWNDVCGEIPFDYLENARHRSFSWPPYRIGRNHVFEPYISGSYYCGLITFNFGVIFNIKNGFWKFDFCLDSDSCQYLYDGRQWFQCSWERKVKNWLPDFMGGPDYLEWEVNMPFFWILRQWQPEEEAWTDFPWIKKTKLIGPLRFSDGREYEKGDYVIQGMDGKIRVCKKTMVDRYMSWMFCLKERKQDSSVNYEGPNLDP